MNDLISRSELIKEIDKYCGNQSYLASENVREIIKNQPTAYNLDKVVRQLNLESVGSSIQVSLGLLRAIEIVKQEAEKFGTDTNVGSNGWIPCSVRIPTEQERWFGHDLTDAEPREFIVMVKGAYEPTTGYYHSGYGCWVKDLTSEYDDKNTGYGNEIVAWRFFPQPYQQKGE